MIVAAVPMRIRDGGVGDRGEQHVRRRARDAGIEVVLGEPVPGVAELARRAARARCSPAARRRGSGRSRRGRDRARREGSWSWQPRRSTGRDGGERGDAGGAAMRCCGPATRVVAHGLGQPGGVDLGRVDGLGVESPELEQLGVGAVLDDRVEHDRDRLDQAVALLRARRDLGRERASRRARCRRAWCRRSRVPTRPAVALGPNVASARPDWIGERRGGVVVVVLQLGRGLAGILELLRSTRAAPAPGWCPTRR